MIIPVINHIVPASKKNRNKPLDKSSDGPQITKKAGEFAHGSNNGSRKSQFFNNQKNDQSISEDSSLLENNLFAQAAIKEDHYPDINYVNLGILAGNVRATNGPEASNEQILRQREDD